MAVIVYPDSIERDPWAKHGERVSVKDFGAVSDGVADCSAAFQMAYDSVVGKGGGSITIPGVGTPGMSYKLNTPIELDSDVPISWLGQGRSSKVTRGAALPADKALFNLSNAKNLSFHNFLVDGTTTTSVGLLYSEFSSNPMHPLLTLNTSFWVHGGEDLEWNGVHIEHTGGYAILLDARLLNVKRVKIHHGMLRNNRPHTFGTAVADMMDAMRRVRGVKIDWERHFPELLAGSASIYGSWTGGILGQNQATGGSSTKVSDLNVSNNRFERNTGNCVWQHGYGFDSFHQQIHVDYNSFLDCGLDGILFGNVIGGSAIGNSFRRIGYICSDDTSAGVPRWLPNLNATGLDTSGVVKLVNYANNSFLNVNGGAINGDGFAYGTITGNSIRVSRPGEPEYSEDSIGSGFGPGGAGANWSQGIVLGNTADKEGGLGVTISGNFCDNLGGTAIGLYAARKCQAQNNLIIAPDAPGQNPIMIGGLLTGSNQVARDNLVTENSIHFNPAQPAPAIFEDPTYRPFTPADMNRVVKNVCLGGPNVFEFKRDPNTDTKCAIHFTTEAVASYSSRHGIAREGIGEGSSLRFYAQDSDPWGNIHMSLNMYRAQGARGPLLNVSETGPGPPEVVAEGGCITTGSVTQLPYGNAMATGNLSASGFLALGDSTYWEVEADMLPSTHPNGWALLRWDGLLAKWQQSVEGGGAAGPRIWTDFSAGGGGSTAKPADPVDSVQFNRAGAFGGSADFIYTESAKRLTIYGTAALPGINVTGGYIQSAQGFVAMPATATTYNAIQASNGGVYALSATIKNYITWGSNAAPVPTINDTFLDNGVINYDDPNKIFNFRTGQYNQATQNTDLVDVSCFALGFAASSGATNAVQAPAGGVTGQWLIAQDSLIFIGRTQPPVSGPGQVRIYAAVSGQLYVSSNTAPYGPFGNTPPGAPEGSVQYNRGGQFGGDANFFWDEGVNRLYITCAPTAPAISTSGGWIQSEGGFLTFNTGNAIQAPEGAVLGKWLGASESLVFTGLGAPPALSTASPPQVRLYASSGGQMYISSNGAAWGPFGTGTLPASSDGAIQYNDAGSFGGHPNFYWHKTAFQMYLNTYAGQPGLTVTGGWVQSQGGFFTDSASALAVNAQSGGVTARWIAANESLLFLQRSEPDRSTGGQVRLYANTNGVLYISTGGQPYGPLVTSALAAGTHSMVQYNNSGYFGAEAAFYYNDSSDTLTVPNITATGTTWGSVSSSGVISAVRFYSNVGDGEWQYLMNSPWRQWGFRTGADGSQQWVDYSGGNAPFLIYGHTSPASIRLVTGGSVQANQFYSPYAGFDAVNAGNGGSYARSHRAAVYTQIGQNYGQGIAFTGGDSLQFGCLFYDTSVGVAKIYISSGWQTIATGTFSGITSTTQPSWTATNSGYSYTFNNSNGNFVVNGQGDLTAYGVITTTGPSGGFNCTGQQARNSIQTYGGFNAGSGGGGNGVYQIGGSDVINNSRQFVGYGGINTSGHMIASGNCVAASYQISGGYYGQDYTLYFPQGFQLNGQPKNYMYFKGGIIWQVT